MSPRIAIIHSDTLAAIGLKSMLQAVVPVAEVDVFGSLSELSANHPERYFHYFAAFDIVLRHRSFFAGHCAKTIVLTPSADASQQLAGHHCLCVSVPEHQLVRSLLALEQSAHANGRHLPPPEAAPTPTLTEREVEVMVLIVEGHINKEIASKLGIGLSTVITHRKRIMEKLSLRSVSALTIYAVMHGYVDVSRI